MIQSNAGRTGGKSPKIRLSRLASGVTQGVKDRVRDSANATAAGIADIADALDRAGEELDARQRTFASQLARESASGLSGLAGVISDRSADEMLDAARDFGRRHPTTFLAVCVLTGFALGRIATATPPSEPAGSYPLEDGADAAPAARI
jgi:hypothetical protein